jgi:Cys-tRNA(Pro)/Cys-tRNA(Cys) deacylase
MTGYNVFVVPSSIELDLKRAAFCIGDKYVEMIKSRELEPLTGYIHGGCSPIGMKKLLPTFIEEIASVNETVCVNAGRIGLLIEISPYDLLKITNAKYCSLI